ncbi:MAG TPA: hypothetical protein VFP93_04175 [Gammaproteobacteria bacterium]|nr:hypothetical protein [Gammaproteobacteria bacterium]
MSVGDRLPNQVNLSVLKKLALFIQKEINILIDHYVKDSQKLMEKLKVHITNADLKHIQRTVRDLRQSSQEIGAMQFSFLLLSLEIAVSEYRVREWQPAYNKIEQYYNWVIDELATIRGTPSSILVK